MRIPAASFIACLFSVLLTGCRSSGGEAWKNYTDNTHHYQIQYPGNWTKSVNGNGLLFLSPQEDVSDFFREDVGIKLDDLSQHPMDLAQYTELGIKGLKSKFGENAILSQASATIAGLAAEEIVYNTELQDKTLKVKQYWFIKNNVAYILTFCAEDPQQFDKYQPTAMKIIQSFKFGG